MINANETTKSKRIMITNDTQYQINNKFYKLFPSPVFPTEFSIFKKKNRPSQEKRYFNDKFTNHTLIRKSKRKLTFSK